jgi:surfeit locus 1 family protein
MKRWLLIAIAAFATVGFGALGMWQVERRAWKLALIERVEQRVHAAPVAAPGPAEWAGLSRENAEYRRVTLSGRFLEGQQTRVRAVTELGGGFWLMAPLQTNDGFTVLVNRGFVPADWHSGEHPAVEAAHTGVVTVTGLLRLSEPRGAFLRSNAPAENRWYSRDVEAISHAQHLSRAAPYFIDAEADKVAGASQGQPPVAGLTVVHFRNSHLQYAITWFILALMALGLGVRVARTRPTPAGA